ncbi:restriction endonuclease subunit S [Staphylococcus hominis]|uniref:Restriction endonuclease subunit S n=1 Tax=Staphylococcus hominis TaxID=1290 RepID=A0A6N0I2P0_STAHO|nr:restriction endonuclease subunit S [Staphylococcus hominis]
MTNQINTPELRFPNYKDSWFSYKLNDISERVTRKNKNLESQRPLTISGQLGLIDQIEYFNKSVSSKNLTGYTLIKKGEFAYNKSYSNGYPLGAIKKLERYDLGILSSLYICFSFNKNIDKNFMKNYFESTKWYREVANIAVEGARNHGLLNIPVNDFFNININLPIQYEQEKIGNFFSKLDQQIELEEKKLELLEQQKRGYMQKIFSQQLRFKDENGNDYPEWKKKKLDDVAHYRRGSFPQPYGNKEWYDEKNGEPFVQVVDVDKNMKLHDKTKQKISDLAKPKSVKGFKGDIVVTLQGSIGRVAILQYDAYIDRTLLLINSFKIKMNKNYFNYVLYLLFLREKERAPGGTIKTITKSVLSNFEIDIPTLEEQNKIGMFFNEIDNLIELQNNKINHLKQRKQGLLQKMFV